MSKKYKTTNQLIVSTDLNGNKIQAGTFFEKTRLYYERVKQSNFSQRDQAFPMSEYIVKQIARLGCMWIMLVAEKEGGEKEVFMVDMWTFIREAKGAFHFPVSDNSWWYLPLKFWEKIHLGQTNDSD